jgi:hypothetical protein
VPPGDQVAVPPEDGVGTDQQLKAQQCGPRQRVQQRRQPGSVHRFKPDLPVELAPQYRELVP